MGNKLYVGNLSVEITEADLHEFFSTFGTVLTVKIKRDNVTGDPWGYGFVEMEDQQAAETALNGANGQQLGQNILSVNATRSP